MQREVGRRCTDLMLRILGVVTSEEGPGALTKGAMDILDPGRTLLLRQYDHTRLESLPPERGRQAIEVTNYILMVLHKHRGDRVELRTEVEEGKSPERLTPCRIHLMSIDITIGIDRWVHLQLPIPEGHRPIPLQLRCRIGVDRRAIGEGGRDIDPIGS